MEKILRFAPIIRVSTDAQAKKGESLITQKTQIVQYVKTLGGVIPESCWQYCGQESATKKERILWDKLLLDSSKNIFDAIIVCDASRWSRNNQKSLEGLEILRNNKIRFFIGTSEKNLNLPADRMTLGLFTTLNQFIAEEQTRKSQDNRVLRAKEGRPTAGKMPYGRKWNKKTSEWEIDPEKHQIIKDTARRYLKGESIKDIAKSYNVDASTLFKSLTQRCGTTWECRYKDKLTNTEEVVIMTIPRLLDQKIIDEVKEKMRNNITYERGNKRKYDFLLQGLIFCKRCEFNMHTFRNHQGLRYYRHSSYSKNCDLFRFVPAEQIENAVLMKLVQTFGDRELIEKAIQKATPDIAKIEELNKDSEDINKELLRITKEKKIVITGVSKELYSDEEAKPVLEELRNSEKSLNIRLAVINAELEIMPNPEQIKKASSWAVKVLSNATKNNPKLIFKRSYEWKRKLVEFAFAGTDPTGRHYGVYVDTSKGKGQITFEIRGLFNSTVIGLPMNDKELNEAFDLNSPYHEDSNDSKLNKKDKILNGDSIWY